MTTRTRKTPEAIAHEWIQTYPAIARQCALDAKAGRTIDTSKHATAKRWVIAHTSEALSMANAILQERFPHIFATSAAESTAPATTSTPAPINARQMILDAFTRLDREGYNQVGIVALVDDTCLPLPVLHVAIQALRWEGILTLAALEGRHGITQRERETAIHEHGDMLGYVSRCV